MCLAVPGRVEAITEIGGVLMGRVNFGGIVKDVCLEYVPEIAVGDYTIVHVGFALSRIDEESARRTLKTFEEMGLLEEEFGEEFGAESGTEDEEKEGGGDEVPYRVS